MSALSAHRAWCNTSECVVDDTPDDEQFSHYGHPVPVDIDRDDIHADNGILWRNQPSGRPELHISPLVHEGRAGVRIEAGDNRTAQSTSGGAGLSWLTPAEARQLARLIEQAADQAESTSAAR